MKAIKDAPDDFVFVLVIYFYKNLKLKRGLCKMKAIKDAPN